MLEPLTLESIRNTWSDLLIGLVRSYHGNRMKMWSRIPDMMCGSARQTASLDRWYTLTLRSLQIETQGSAAQASSLCSIWSTRRAWFHALGPDRAEVERLVLRLLREERATITALAQERWEQIKATRPPAASPETSPGPETSDETTDSVGGEIP